MAISLKYFQSDEKVYVTVPNMMIIPVTDALFLVEGLTPNEALTIGMVFDDPSTDGATVQVFSRRYYAGVENEVELDLREELRQLLELKNISEEDGEEPGSFLNITLSVGVSNFYFVVTLNSCFTDITTPWSDLDAVDVDADTEIRYGIRNPHSATPEQVADGGSETDTVSVSVMTRRGVRLVDTITLTGSYYQPFLMARVAVSDLPVAQDEPFRIIFGQMTDGVPAPSPVYRLRPGTAERYLFLNRHGMLDSLPMFGTLSETPDFDFETAATASRRVSVRAGKDDAYTQDSGYLSAGTFRALGELLTSRQIYHWKDGEWRQIVIEETDYSFSEKDHLHSCSFKYRYCDKS